jgi:UDPglucose--hexose-1-phosphate uridylyltransferase
LSGPELRVDQLTGLRTIVAPSRGVRPNDLAADPAHHPAERSREAGSDSCPFCPGREDQTPAELDAIRGEDGSWRARAVPNKYPAVAAEDGGAAAVDPLDPHTGRGDPDLFSSSPATGAHEVLVHSPRHVTSLSQLDDAEIDAAVSLWRRRLRANGESPFRHLIVNEGKEAGASREHTHAQLYGLAFVPAVVARERERFGAHNARTMGGCLLCDIASEEVRRGDRLVAVDDECLLICPWGSRSPYELRIVPRRHAPRFEDDGEVGTAMLARATRALAATLGSSPPLNLWVRTSPGGAEHFHWHIDVCPRLTIRAGLEMGAGVELNVVSPEQAAADLRERVAD